MSARKLFPLLPIALSLLVAACSPATSPDEDAAEQEQAIAEAQRAAEQAALSPSGVEAPPAPTCDASQVQGMEGQAFDEGMAEQARSDAGASRVRVLRPGQAVTLEFDGTRLNIEIGDDGRIAALRCG
ncbi:I78 family peptidase inhibitor [Pseudoxanthomonas koreensis]|uniref:I78 family peptidase inhibitor n=1 Tax=Pseudoxanthomonas koreensis TaxID=266061 RepID=UPI0035A6AE80